MGHDGNVEKAAGGSVAAEIARRFRLKAQLEHPLAGHPYDMVVAPPGFDGALATDAAAGERLIEGFKACLREAEAGGDAEVQRRLVWTALHVTDEYRRSEQGDNGRRSLEMALSALSDRGHQDLVRCRLAREELRRDQPAAAARWLDACDAAPEILDLDSAYREARGLWLAATGDLRGVLALLGDNLEELPVAQEQRAVIAALRIHALEASGRHAEARVELGKAGEVVGAKEVGEALALGGWAPAARAADDCSREVSRAEEGEELRKNEWRARAAELDRLLAARRDARTGGRALSAPLVGAPLAALLLWVFPITPIRCLCSADPFMGVQGNVLCPHLCEGCTGPYRVHTIWRHTGPGKSSTNGPQYFCRTPQNEVATMSDAEMDRHVSSLGKYELYAAPAAATYLTLLVLLLPLVLYAARKTHMVSIARRERFEGQARALHAELRASPGPDGATVPLLFDPDAVDPAPPARGLGFALGLFALCGVVPFLVIVLEIALR